MADHDEHLHELARQAQNATALGRLSHHEVVAAIKWLSDGGHMTRTGKPLEKPRPAPTARANKPDGTPIYDPGVDFRTHETVTMQAGRAS